MNINRRELLGVAVSAAVAGTVKAEEPDVKHNGPGQPDVIFIGAGINSLGAALLLSEAGWNVLVIDRNKVPGGAVRTLELTLPGFHHDIGAMNLTVLAHSPFYTERKKLFAEKGVEFITADHTFGSMDREGRFLGMSNDVESNLRAIGRFSDVDAKAWKQWTVDFQRCAPVLFRVFGSEAAESGPLEYAFGEHSDVPTAIRPTIKGILVDSLRSNLTARFETPVVQALIAAWGLHIDYAPDIAGGCWMPFLETNADQESGILLVRGGSGRLMLALCDLIGDRGGHVRTNQTVERILFERDRAVGVRLAGGETIRASRAVVASVTPPALLKLADGKLPLVESTRAATWSFGPGTLVIHLALSKLPQWKDVEARKSFYVHLGPNLDHLAAAYQQGMAGLLSDQPFCVVGQPTVYDTSRAPEGKHVLWIMVRAVPAVIRGDVAGKIRGSEWTNDVKEAFADRVLALIEHHAPRLREQILGKKIISPTDLENLNPNLVGGDLNAGSQHLSQFYGQRPFVGGSRTPINGLYLCGASTWPGGGCNPGSGVIVAKQLLETHG